MGGNLFKLGRMPRADYLRVEAAMREYLDVKLGPDGYRIPRYYGSKPDFGDMDVIVPSRPEWGALREEIVRELGIDRVKPVGHVYSTVFRGLQTDFFSIPPEYVESTYNFMSFNDLGNLLGRMFRRFNLKYGERGLSYVYRRATQTHYKAELPVTLDFAKMCAFLGTDYPAWQRGFNSLTEVFDWAVASPYFSVAPYFDQDRMEKRERTTIQRFIEYLRERGIDRRPEFRDRMTYLAEICAAFPEANLAEQVAAEQRAEQRSLALAAKFNGDLVMKLRPELEGRALSELIIAFKSSIPNFEDFVLAADPAELERLIREFNKV